MAYNRGERPDSPMKRRGGRRRKKVCVFCGKENSFGVFFQKKNAATLQTDFRLLGDSNSYTLYRSD